MGVFVVYTQCLGSHLVGQDQAVAADFKKIVSVLVYFAEYAHDGGVSERGCAHARYDQYYREYLRKCAVQANVAPGVCRREAGQKDFGAVVENKVIAQKCGADDQQRGEQRQAGRGAGGYQSVLSEGTEKCDPDGDGNDRAFNDCDDGFCGGFYRHEYYPADFQAVESGEVAGRDWVCVMDRRRIQRQRANNLRGGFTLIETVFAIMIVGLAIVALMMLFASGTQVNAVGNSMSSAVFLAGEIRSLIDGVAFEDLGLFPGTYNGIDAAGNAVPGMESYRQIVEVQSVNPTDMTPYVGTDPNAIRLTVRVVYGKNAQEMTRVSWLRVK